MQQPRPIMTDQSQKASSFNPSYIQRFEDAMLSDEIAKKLEYEQSVKSGKINENKVRGVSERETDLMRRIASVSQRPENNSSAYRTQERIKDHQEWVNKNLKEDLARERKYQKELKESLALEAYLS